MQIELVLFIYNLAFMTTSVVEQAFFIFQACHNDFGFAKNICFEVEKYPDIQTIVHNRVSEFQNYNTVISQTVTFMTALFYVLQYETCYKKTFIILGLSGKLIYVCSIIINSLLELDLELILYSAVLPSSITGADILIISNAFAYLSENVSSDTKDYRITLLNTIILTTMPLGTILGDFLFKHTEVFKDSFERMFLLNALLLSVAVLLAIFLKKDSLEVDYIKNPGNTVYLGEAHQILTEHVVISEASENTKKLLFKTIGNHKISLLVIMSGLHILQRSEKIYLYMFTQYKLSWSFEVFSAFRFSQTLLLTLVSIIASLILMNVKINNFILICFGVTGNILSRIFYIFANNQIVFYIGGILTAFGPLTSSAIKCQLAQIVKHEYLRVVFVITTACENLLTVCAAFLYNFIYTSMMKEWVFTITIGSQIMIILLVILYVLKKEKKEITYV